MKYLIQGCFLVVCLSLSLAGYAKIYEWTDKDGTVHFEDQSHEGAKKVKLPPVQTYTPAPIPEGIFKEEPKEPVQVAEDVGYEQITLVEPQDQATYWNDRWLDVVVDLVPALKEGDKLQMYLDGQPAGE